MKWKVRTTTAINQNNGKNPRHVGDEEDAFMTPFHFEEPAPRLLADPGDTDPEREYNTTAQCPPARRRPVYAGPGGCGILS